MKTEEVLAINCVESEPVGPFAQFVLNWAQIPET